MLGYRIISYLLPLISTLLISLLFYEVGYLKYIYVLIFIFIFLGTYFFIIEKVKEKKLLLSYVLFNLLISYSSLTMFLFLENIYFKIGIVLVNLFLSFIFLNNLFTIYFKKIIIDLNKLYLFFKQAQLFLIFFIASSFFGLRDFFNYSPYLTLIFFYIIIFLVTWYHDWQNYNLSISKLSYRLIYSLIITQVFWALTILPQLYFLKGIILTIIYFIFNELIIWNYTHKYEFKYLRNIMIVSIIIIILLLYTAIWF